jgi:signal peptidase I
MNAEFLKRWRRSEVGLAAKPRPERRRRGDVSLLHIVYQGIMFTGLAFGSYLFFSHFVVQSVRVLGTSMSPTLLDSDCCLVNRFAAFCRAPQRGDIVVFEDPTDRTHAVKRVIGLAGDTIELRAGAVYLNGARLEESYLKPGTQTYPFTCIDQIVHCGPNEFFVLGDNRFYSDDSRSYGSVSRHAILGLVMR